MSSPKIYVSLYFIICINFPWWFSYKLISSIRQRASMLTGRETVQEYQVYVSVRVKCEDVKNNKVLWEKTISQYGTMSAAATQDERDQAIGVAVEKITEDIVNNTLGFW